MPETYPGISFDEEGVCSFCRRHGRAGGPLGKDDLVRLIGPVKGRGQYDCVVPLSGGKDSTYILYYAVRELGLRTVAANYDSGYQSEIARKNVRAACEALDVPLVAAEPKGDIQKELLRQVLLVSQVVGCFTRTCTNCEVMLRTVALNTARKHNVPFILWGSSSLESPDYDDYADYRYGRKALEILTSKRATLRRLKLTPGKVARLVPMVMRYTMLSIRERLQMNVPMKCVLNPYGIPAFPKTNPAVIHFYDYISWDPAEATELLKRELGWEHPPGKPSRFDCTIHCFVEHKNLQLTGISSGGTIDCNLVREGRMTREEALRREDAAGEAIREECREMVERIGLRDYRIPGL